MLLCLERCQSIGNINNCHFITTANFYYFDILLNIYLLLFIYFHNDLILYEFWNILNMVSIYPNKILINVRLSEFLSIESTYLGFYYMIIYDNPFNSPIIRLIRSTLYRKRVKRNQNNVMETFVLYEGYPSLLSRRMWNCDVIFAPCYIDNKFSYYRVIKV